MRIAVRGWSGKHNVGDDAYRIAIPNLLPLHSVEFWEGDDMASDCVPDPDLFILGGGDVVYPEFTNEFRARPGVRRLVASVTLTPTSDYEFLQTCEKVFVRDFRSFDLAAANGVAAEYLPDFAFALEPDAGAGKALVKEMFEAEGRQLYEKVVVVVGSAYLMHSGLNALARDHAACQYVSQELARTFDRTNASFLFVPFGTGNEFDDRACNAYIASRCQWWQKNLVVYERLGVQQTLNILAAADVVVSSRLHSSIFATMAGVPFLNITHHDKGRGFVELVMAEADDFSFWEFDAARFRGRLEGHLSGRIVRDDRLTLFSNLSRRQLREATLL